MKFTCEKYALLVAILTASRAVAAKSPVPLLEGLLLEVFDDGIRITGYDLKIGIVTVIPAEVTETGGVVLNARLFGEIIRKAPGDMVTIDVNARFVATISSEMSEFEILGSPITDFPELPVVEGDEFVEIESAVLKKMISRTNFAVSDNETRPIHTGALFEAVDGEFSVVAVDGYRLAVCREPMENIGPHFSSFVVPGTALSEVEKVTTDSDDKVIIKLGEKHIQFLIGDTILITRRLEGEFLNYRGSIPQTSKYQLTVRKDEFISAVERVSLILSEKLKGPVRCVFGDELIKLSSTSALGKASDECGMEGNGEDLEIGFNDKYLIEALRAAPAEELQLGLNTGVAPCVITPADGSNNFIYMILPVRLKAYES